MPNSKQVRPDILAAAILSAIATKNRPDVVAAERDADAYFPDTMLSLLRIGQTELTVGDSLAADLAVRAGFSLGVLLGNSPRADRATMSKARAIVASAQSDANFMRASTLQDMALGSKASA